MKRLVTMVAVSVVLLGCPGFPVKARSVLDQAAGLAKMLRPGVEALCRTDAGAMTSETCERARQEALTNLKRANEIILAARTIVDITDAKSVQDAADSAIDLISHAQEIIAQWQQ